MARRPRTDKVPSWAAQHLPEELIDSVVFRFKITLKDGRKVAVDLLPDADVDYDHLERQLEECPAQFVHWFTLYSEMKAHAAYIERRIKARRGVLTEQATRSGKDNGVRLTQDQIKQIVEADEELNELEGALILVNKHTGKLYGMTLALQMKSEHLRSLAGFKRAERERS